MDPFVLGSLISAGASLLGGGGQAASAKYATDVSRESADKQMAFQERMSSTSHQREVADLRAAGLNPILSATGGSGSSAPSGASFSASVPDVSSMVSNAIAAVTAVQQLKLLSSQIRSVDAGVVKTAAETGFITDNMKNLSTARELQNANRKLIELTTASNAIDFTKAKQRFVSTGGEGKLGSAWRALEAVKDLLGGAGHSSSRNVFISSQGGN